MYQAETECQDTHHDNCDFQNGLCKWKNSQTEIGSWIVTFNEENGPRYVDKAISRVFLSDLCGFRSSNICVTPYFGLFLGINYTVRVVAEVLER